MKKPRATLWFIIILTLFAILVDFPKVPAKFNFGPLKVDTVLVHPRLRLGSFVRDLEPQLGLDLKGGTHLVLAANMEKIETKDRDAALDSAKNIIAERINRYGVSEPVVQSAKTGDEYRIVAELPGVTDINQAVVLIGQTAQLEFGELKNTTGATLSATLAADPRNYQSTGLTGKDLVRATPTFSRQTGKPEVQLEFSSEGAKKFEEITKRNLGQPLAIFLDNQLIEAPVVQSLISGGQAVITGNFTSKDTTRLAIQLNAGALPVPIKVIEQRNIGPTLGAESISKSLLAGAIGFAIVACFMLAYYGLTGLLADIALAIYTLLALAIFKLVPITLTLAGIAGFILSVGMAVDANILIFERMKEEIRWGQPRIKAIELGFTRAFSSIRDSNISSLITCTILYYFGTGIIRGFALTLAIGILLSMFSAITITRTFLKYTYR